MIYHRITPTRKHLTEDDYIRGFGIDSDLMIQIRQAKRKLGINVDSRIRYDNRTGFAIDMTPFNNKYHPIFQNDILDTETEKQLQIDGYYQMYYYGKYWTILAMDKDTRSHRTITWEIETCKEPEWIEDSIENKKKYKLVPAETPRWNSDGTPNINN